MSTRKLKSVDSLKSISSIKTAFKVSTGKLKSVDSLRSIGSIKTILRASTVDPIVNFIKVSTVDFKALKALNSTKTSINFISLALKSFRFY